MSGFVCGSRLYFWSIRVKVVKISYGWKAAGEGGEQAGEVEAVVWSEGLQCCEGDWQYWITSSCREGVYP